jgi:hypothetical protein
MKPACCADQLLARTIHDGSWRNCGVERDERERRDGRDGRRFEVRSSRLPKLRTPNFVSRFSRQSRPSRLSQASAIAAERFMNHAGKSLQKTASLRSFPPIDLYKSTRCERLNLCRSVLTPDAWPTWTSSHDATAPHENTVAARHPTASLLGACPTLPKMTDLGG